MRPTTVSKKGPTRKGMMTPVARAQQMIQAEKRPNEVARETSLGRKQLSMLRSKRSLD